VLKHWWGYSSNLNNVGQHVGGICMTAWKVTDLSYKGILRRDTMPHNHRQALNYANLVSYVLSLLLIYLSLTGIFGETNTALSSKYQTLVTPSGWAFSIWGPIYIFEGVFAVAQMLPSYRNSPVVTKGVSYLWCFVCLMQIAWTMSFAQEQIWLATVFMYFICFGLVAIVYRTNVLFKVARVSTLHTNCLYFSDSNTTFRRQRLTAAGGSSRPHLLYTSGGSSSRPCSVTT